jgi:8-oxo-dGTP pyrophosphatase MutT (NUDIX family)
MDTTRHFTATVLIVYENRVLLHLHKKRGILLPVGGHLEQGELPEEAALREVREETGLSVKLYNPEASSSISEAVGVHHLIKPIHMQLIEINEHHQHIDFIFYARALTNQLAPAQGETADFYWLNQGEVLKHDMPENVRALALEALALLD